MRIIDHAGQEREQWRPGVLTRMRVSARTGAAQLCIFEQWCDLGYGAPTHLHAVEEVLTVLAGSAEVWVGEERATVTAGQSVIIPAGHRHGFRNNGEAILHVEATLAAPCSRLPSRTCARQGDTGFQERSGSRDATFLG
jgi:mannose-6-phosphate isomerase-like protein (cupin superfamily)